MKPILILFVAILSFAGLSAQTKVLGVNHSDANFYSQHHAARSTTFDTDTIFSFPSPGKIPSGLCFDGMYLWHCDTSAYIYKYSTLGEKLDSIPHPGGHETLRAGGLTFDGNNLWLVNEESAQLFNISREGAILKQFYLPSITESDPNGTGICWDGEFLWHSQYEPACIYKLSPVDGHVVDSVITPHKILWLEWVQNKLYGLNVPSDYKSYSLFEIDTATGEYVDAIDWILPYAMDICWDGQTLWGGSGAADFFGIPTNGTMRIYMVKTELSIIGFSTNTWRPQQHPRIFPVPFASSLTIESAQPSTLIGNIQVTDLQGKVLYSRWIGDDASTIHLDFLPKGYYLLSVQQNVFGIIKE